MALRIALVLVIVVTATQGRPQEALDEIPLYDALDQLPDTPMEPENILPETRDSPVMDLFGFTRGLGNVAETGRDIYNAAVSSGQNFMNGIKDMIFGFWRTGAQALLGMNSAVRETAVDFLQGVKDTVGATGEFIQGAVRTGGRLAADTVTAGFNVSREAAGASGKFVTGMGRGVADSFKNVAGATADFVEGAVDGVGKYATGAGDLARKFMVGGIENFTNQ